VKNAAKKEVGLGDFVIEIAIVLVGLAYLGWIGYYAVLTIGGILWTVGVNLWRAIFG
jgi:hypothetical protein